MQRAVWDFVNFRGGMGGESPQSMRQSSAQKPGGLIFKIATQTSKKNPIKRPKTDHISEQHFLFSKLNFLFFADVCICRELKWRSQNVHILYSKPHKKSASNTNIHY
jgi:hypothetical protein